MGFIPVSPLLLKTYSHEDEDAEVEETLLVCQERANDCLM